MYWSIYLHRPSLCTVVILLGLPHQFQSTHIVSQNLPDAFCSPLQNILRIGSWSIDTLNNIYTSFLLTWPVLFGHIALGHGWKFTPSGLIHLSLQVSVRPWHARLREETLEIHVSPYLGQLSHSGLQKWRTSSVHKLWLSRRNQDRFDDCTFSAVSDRLLPPSFWEWRESPNGLPLLTVSQTCRLFAAFWWLGVLERKITNLWVQTILLFKTIWSSGVCWIHFALSHLYM